MKQEVVMLIIAVYFPSLGTDHPAKHDAHESDEHAKEGLKVAQT